MNYQTGEIKLMESREKIETIIVQFTGFFCRAEAQQLLFRSSARGALLRAFRINQTNFNIGSVVDSFRIDFTHRGFNNAACQLNVYAALEDATQPPPPTHPTNGIAAKADDLSKKMGLFALDLEESQYYYTVAESAKDLYSQLRDFVPVAANSRNVYVIKNQFYNVEETYNRMTRNFYRAHADALDEVILESYERLRYDFKALQGIVGDL